MKGTLITFEGSEGCGKSTQIELVCRYLRKKNKPILFVREPGGVKISEKVRNVLLDIRNAKMGSECETLLYMAARAQLVKEVIAPALKKGKIVLCDRFLDSTIAYQGYGNGVDIKAIERIGRFATQDIRPKMTFFFDIDAKKGLSRIQGRKKDRIERRTISYHNRVRQGYIQIARREPGRVKLINADQPKEEIFNIVKGHIDRLLKLR
ncbi:MAG: dTMP kinase [Candidatus Omnitrophica bacterium]|nr:dTMP kinase [Candidatus Omnitrophota bacterium]